MQDELPLALVEQQAEARVAADEGGEDHDADGLEEPDRVDDLGSRGGWSWGGLVWLIFVGLWSWRRHLLLFEL